MGVSVGVAVASGVLVASGEGVAVIVGTGVDVATGASVEVGTGEAVTDTLTVGVAVCEAGGVSNSEGETKKLCSHPPKSAVSETAPISNKIFGLDLVLFMSDLFSYNVNKAKIAHNQ